MKVIELDLNYDMTVVKCPFCGETLFDKEGLHECPHLLFHASDFGPEFVREDFPYKFGEEPIDEDALETDDEEDDKSFWEHIEEVEMKDSFCFALVNNAPPCMCGAGFVGYIGLCQHTEEEYKQYV